MWLVTNDKDMVIAMFLYESDAKSFCQYNRNRFGKLYNLRRKQNEEGTK